MTRDELRSALAHPNVRAFLRVIREGESSQDDATAYRMLYGGGFFASFDNHPHQVVTANGISSSAAGAYQILQKTHAGLVAKYGFTDFTPATQDEMAVALIAGRGALQDLLRGDLSEVLDKTSWEWASLPPHRYPGQGGLDAKRVYATYEKWLHPAAAPAPEPVATPEKKMPAPFIGLALEALLTAVPTLIRSFGKGTRSEDNAKLAEVIVPIAKQAIGATNEQDLVERVMNDPAALQKVDQAIQANWLSITEAGGGGIEGAREYNLKAAGVPAGRQPAFIISLLLLLFPLLLLVDVFFIHSAAYTSELRTQIVTGVLMILSMVGGFWLGSSFTTSTTRGVGARPQ